MEGRSEVSASTTATKDTRDRVVLLRRLVDVEAQKKKKNKGDSGGEDECSSWSSSTPDSFSSASSRYAHLQFHGFTFPHRSSTPIPSLFSNENEEENEEEKEEGEQPTAARPRL